VSASASLTRPGRSPHANSAAATAHIAIVVKTITDGI